MGVKYTLSYKDNANISWRVDISTSAFSGAPYTLTGQGGQAFILDRSPDSADDPFSPYIKSTGTINVYDENHVIDLPELQNAQDKDFVATVYRNSLLYWIGYVIPDGIQNPMKSIPQISLSCTDGLSLLENMPYSHNNLPGLTSTPTRCPMNYIRQILFSTNNLGLPLPISWTNNLINTAFSSDPDVLTGQVTWSALGEGFVSFQTPTPTSPGTGYVYKTCDYILQGILKSMQCRIVQDGGQWVIRRINDIVTGSITNKSIAGNLGIMTLTTSTVNINKTIGATGYKFINEDQLTTVKHGVKTCRTTYNANVRENILPNGNQDLVNTFFTSPFYWGINDGSGDETFQSVGAIDGRGGAATDLINPSGGLTAGFILVDNSNVAAFLPINSYTLIKRIQFGFVFSPVNGFPYNATTGIIDFSSNPMQLEIIYKKGTDILYLDEFAIWRNTNTFIPIKIDGLKINDIVSVDFNRNNSIIIPIPANDPIPGDNCSITVQFIVKDGQRYTIDYIYFTTDANNDVYESTYASGKNTDIDERTLEISSSFGGYFVSNYMTHWSKSGDEFYFQDSSFYTGSLTGLTSNAIMRFMYKSSVIYNGSMYVGSSIYSFDELYSIDTLSGKYLPLNSSYNTETCIVSGLVAIECRNDVISLTEKHFGSNDSQLSN